MPFAWNFTGGQDAYDAAQAALQNKRNADYIQNMDDRTVGNVNDMMQWMQQGNDAAPAAAPAPAPAAAVNPQAPVDQKAARIKEIQAEIADLERRIAMNKKAMEMNDDALNTNLAAAELRKINSGDPTGFWKWKQSMDFQKATRKQDMERLEAEKKKNKEEQKQYLLNKINATLPTMQVGWNTTPEQAQQYKNTLAGLKAEAMNNRMPLDQIRDMEAQLGGELPYQRAQNAMNEMRMAADRFNITEADGGFGKNAKKYQDFLLQQYTKITRDYPEAKYDPEFNKVFQEADQKFRKKVKNKKIVPPGRK